jgi:tryptophan synthase alpha chain
MSDVKVFLHRLKNSGLRNPILVGFGIKDRETFVSACENANGAIIGTAFIKAIENSTDLQKTSAAFVKSILTEN